MTKTPQVDDADVDKFIATFFAKLNPTLTSEERTDAVHDFTLAYITLIDPEATPAWAKEFARRVRARALWLKPD